MSLPEPRVLAHAKRRLFPDTETTDTYAVVDTQFAVDEWLAGEPIDTELRERLAPFNHVRVGSGYPDLVGVGTLDSELLAVERFGDQPPLMAIEAKGHTGAGTGTRAVDVEGGVVQAYDRLHEANAAYVAAPKGAISQSARTLARALNVGVLGVVPGGAVDPLEVPRVVGNRTSDDATAIRFQATAQGVAEASFGLNHPKNYLAYPLALCHSGDAETVLAEHVVEAVDDARRGATFLGLVEELQTMHDDGIREPSLVTLVEWLHVQHPTFTVELFLRGSDDVRARVLDEDGELRTDELADGTVFHSPTVFQLKAMLYHAGILTERGAEPHRLDPTADVWQLREPLD